MYTEVAWVLGSLGTQVQPQIILDPDYLSEYLFVSYHYDKILCFAIIKRSQFRNRVIKSKLNNDITKYKRQCNKVVKLNKRFVKKNFLTIFK